MPCPTSPSTPAVSGAVGGYSSSSDKEVHSKQYVAEGRYCDSSIQFQVPAVPAVGWGSDPCLVPGLHGSRQSRLRAP
jgi:hypothetical protein